MNVVSYLFQTFEMVGVAELHKSNSLRARIAGQTFQNDARISNHKKRHCK